MFSLCLRGLSPGHSHFLPQSKDVLVGDSKLSVGVNVSTNGCVSLCPGPAIEWQPVKDAAFQFVAGGMAFSPLIRNWGQCLLTLLTLTLFSKLEPAINPEEKIDCL